MAGGGKSLRRLKLHTVKFSWFNLKHESTYAKFSKSAKHP